eukprot:GHVQ01033719.1.p1 GENE.GHVQ01033719.1~~GHVQ01033719.1.p1  ORF type:complete len:278 (+),score=76.56 GHVQ01033719.1:105-836(+)
MASVCSDIRYQSLLGSSASDESSWPTSTCCCNAPPHSPCLCCSSINTNTNIYRNDLEEDLCTDCTVSGVIAGGGGGGTSSSSPVSMCGYYHNLNDNQTRVHPSHHHHHHHQHHRHRHQSRWARCSSWFDSVSSFFRIGTGAAIYRAAITLVAVLSQAVCSFVKPITSKASMLWRFRKVLSRKIGSVNGLLVAVVSLVCLCVILGICSIPGGVTSVDEGEGSLIQTSGGGGGGGGGGGMSLRRI